jgi:hypothetical protein
MVLENEYVRVFHVVVPPQQATLVHQHDRDYVWVQIGPADLRNEPLGESPATVKLNGGEVKFVKGGFAHKVTNLADSPFVNVTIEIKNASTKNICGANSIGPKPESQFCGLTLVIGSASTYLLETDRVRASSYEVLENRTEMSPQDAQFPKLLVALTRMHCFCGGSQDLLMNAGDVVWVPRGSLEDVSKIGSEGPRFAVISFK